jgi:signal transduction histidine kinase
VVILAGLVLAWILAGTLARPVRRLEDTAVRLGQGDLEARAKPEGPREVKTLAESFNRMAGALSANMAAQRDFVANASHQLRTPLTGLRLRLEAIQHEGGPGGDEARKAQRELDRLAELIDDLLQLARAASVESQGEPVDLAECARGAFDRWIGPAEEAGKRLNLSVVDGATVWANPDDLGHVLDNLVENAIRYTPEGTEITIQASERNGIARLAVADDGPGIPLQDRERVFDRFYRGTGGRRAGPGSGLGLAIVSELARRWGGDVRLSDDQGTRIEATFPRSLTRS